MAFSGYSGNLLNSQRAEAYAGAQRWGTGINPIHNIRDQEGRDIAEAPAAGELIPEEVVNEWGYCEEDFATSGDMFPYMKQRPPWNQEYTQFRTARNLPPMDQNGDVLRTRSYGADHEGRQVPYLATDVTQFDQKAVYGAVEDAVHSDPSQYTVQTSMAQRDGVRVNTRAQQRSTDRPRSPIGSRVPGQKSRVDNLRGHDMQPKTQNIVSLRGNQSRGVGTVVSPQNNLTQQDWGDWQSRTPIQRQPGVDPFMGADPDGEQPIGADYGYSGEDGGW